MLLHTQGQSTHFTDAPVLDHSIFCNPSRVSPQYYENALPYLQVGPH